MVYSVAAASARRRIAVMATRQATSQGQKRSMGGGPPPEWEGIDKVVRGVFPQDYQRKFLVLQPRTNTVLCACNDTLLIGMSGWRIPLSQNYEC